MAGTGLTCYAGSCLTSGIAVAESDAVSSAMKQVVGDRPVREGRVVFDIPDLAEDGSAVMIGLIIPSPMTEADHVRSVHVFAEENPYPRVISLHFTPASGKVDVITRIRLAGSQTVHAIAEMSDGSLYRSSKHVTVTIGGCGSQ